VTVCTGWFWKSARVRAAGVNLEGDEQSDLSCFKLGIRLGRADILKGSQQAAARVFTWRSFLSAMWAGATTSASSSVRATALSASVR